MYSTNKSYEPSIEELTQIARNESDELSVSHICGKQKDFPSAKIPPYVVFVTHERPGAVPATTFEYDDDDPLPMLLGDTNK